MCWNHFLTNDLYSPFHRYLSKYFDFVNEVNFPKKLDIRGFNLSIRMRQFWSELSQIWFFKVISTSCYNSYGKTELSLFLQISSKTKMRSRFMILYLPSLNSISFIFFPPLLYKSPLSFIPEHTKTLSLLFYWVLVKLSSFIIS